MRPENHQRVENALVLVKDNSGSEIQFIHNPGNKADSVGYYLPVTPFAGEIGKTYSLNVTVDGEFYEAMDELRPVTAIDSLTYTHKHG